MYKYINVDYFILFFSLFNIGTYYIYLFHNMSHAEIFLGLEKASQKHEKEIVIELPSDRFLHFLGVYFLVLLAIVTKISEVAGAKLSCFPVTNTHNVKGSFIKYANVYCWESSNTTLHVSNNTSNDVGSCIILEDQLKITDNMFLSNPTFIKRFIQWLPYCMLLEAFAFALPSAWWHFRVGARMMGHLKFVKLLLQDVYENLMNIPGGIYMNESYSENVGLMRSSENRAQQPDPEKGNCGCCTKNFKAQKDCNDENLPARFLGISDRDLFSTLCHENLSSFSQHPYVASIFQLAISQYDTIGKNNELPMKSALLRHWCHKNNFNKSVIVKEYFISRIIGILVAVISCCLVIVVLVYLVNSGWNTESFLCDVLYHENVCMLCTIPRKAETIGLFLVNAFICFLYFTTSICSFGFLLNTSTSATTDYFNFLNDKNTVALLAAHFANKQKND
ncbi:uncharacterized protein LOC120327271 [Styela clava]